MTDPESNADHSWRLAMMVVMLEKHLSQPLDFRKAIIMALIHDIPEIIAGDPSPLGSDGTGNDSHAYNKEAARKKFENEDKAAKEIFGKLPKEEGDELMLSGVNLKITRRSRQKSWLRSINGKVSFSRSSTRVGNSPRRITTLR